MRTLLFGLAVALSTAIAADLATIQPDYLLGLITPPPSTHSQLRAIKPVILFVGPTALYRKNHIPHAIDVGPASTKDGLESLRKAVDKLPRDSYVVVYCGCCPWADCPNIRPAMALLHDLAFENAHALHLETGFDKNWVDPGYPVVTGSGNP